MSLTYKPSDQVFSYHLISCSLPRLIKLLFFPPNSKKIPGLKYSLNLFTMNLGKPVLSASRYKQNTIAFLAWWANEQALDNYLDSTPLLSDSWHIRMRPYRRWGSFKELDDAHLFEEFKDPVGQVVGLTLARLKIPQVGRFTRWGKPVESQVKNHSGKNLAVVAMKPPKTFSTFSIWNTEQDMLNMVSGRQEKLDGSDHKNAMKERLKKDFHHEFMTMRLVAFKEEGRHQNKSYLAP